MKTEMAEADVAELQQLFDSVEAKQHKRPDMNEDLRLGFASDDFAGTKWKNLTGTARWSPAGRGGSGRPNGNRRTSREKMVLMHCACLVLAEPCSILFGARSILGQQSCFLNEGAEGPGRRLQREGLQPEHAGEDEVRPGGDGRLHQEADVEPLQNKNAETGARPPGAPRGS